MDKALPIGRKREKGTFYFLGSRNRPDFSTVSAASAVKLYFLESAA
jgi:hypothetical protein